MNNIVKVIPQPNNIIYNDGTCSINRDDKVIYSANCKNSGVYLCGLLGLVKSKSGKIKLTIRACEEKSVK